VPADGGDRLAAYVELVELAQRQLDAVEAGRHDALPPLRERWATIVAQLPSVPPEAARPALRRAATLCDALGRRLLAERGDLDRRRGVLDTGQRTARAYGGEAAPDAVALDRTA